MKWVTIAAASLQIASTPVSIMAQCPDGTPPPCRPTLPRPGSPPPNTISVLPFVNRSPDSADAFLAEALPDQIQERLARVGGLQTKSQTVVTAQWRRTPDPMEAARVLRTAWFVTGTVRRMGRTMTVSAELVRASTGDGAWSATFRRADDEIAAIEEAIAESVAVAIVGRLAPAQASMLRRRPARDPEAYRLYLYASTLIRRRSEVDTRAALAALGEAVRIDSAFAAAWGRLGLARVQQASYGFDRRLPRDSLYTLAEVAVARALRLDSANSDALLATGYRAIRRGEFHLARSALERVLRLDSMSADAAHYSGVLYGPLIGLALEGEAARWFRRAASLDPSDRNVWRNLGYIALFSGRLEEGERLLDTALAFGPWVPALDARAQARARLGNGVGALADVAEAERLDSLPRPVSRALYVIALGDSAPARLTLERLTQAPQNWSTELYGAGDQSVTATVVRFYAALGLRDEALEALERWSRTRDPNEPRCAPAVPCSASLRTWRLIQDPIFASLHGHPRFQRLLDQMRPRIPWLP